MSTYAQKRIYQLQKQGCRNMHIPQATLENRSLMGTIDTADPSTGNQIYHGPGAVTTDIISKTTKVWLVTAPLILRAGQSSGEEIMVGRQGIPQMKGQIPVIDDFGNPVSIAEDDLVIDASGIKYKVHNPVATPDDGLWSFQLVRIR